MPGRERSWLGLGLVVLATVFWSTSSMFIKAFTVATGMPSLGLAFWRVFISALCLALPMLVLAPGMLRVPRRDLLWLAGMGMLAVGPFQALWIRSVMLNGASVSTVMQCTAPIVVTVLAWAFWREPLTWHKWAAIGLALAGAALISGLADGIHATCSAVPLGCSVWRVAGESEAGNIHLTSLGLVIVIAVALAYAGVTLFAKPLSGNYSPWTIWMFGFAFAAVALAPFQLGQPLPSHLGWAAIGAFAGLVLLTTLTGYGLYTVGLKHLEASVAAIVAMFEVPCAAFWGYMVLGERLNGFQIVGAVLVVSGSLLLALRSKTDAHPLPSSQPGEGRAWLPSSSANRRQ
jgi:drug/metabolite transporter (DMT)-like permease